jgi:tetratricopeptide (TPR) repeat protein
MTATARFIMLVTGIVVAAAVLMAPRRDEWLAMMWDNDKQAQIISLLEPQLARGEDDPALLATLGRAYAETGNYQHAAELFERYTALRPDDSEAYGRLSDLYKRTGDATRRVAMLKRTIAITPRLSRAVELAALYREEQQSDDELALLSRFSSELTLESGLLLRLAELQAGIRDRDSAIDVLMRPEVVAVQVPPTRNADERLFLADLLVRSGRSAEAVQLGKQWIVQWHEPWLANRLLHSVVGWAPVADASELGDAVAALHPEVRFFLVHGLAQMGARAVARHLLETWIDATPSPSKNEIAAFLSACRDQDEPAVVWRTFGEVLNRPLSNELITRFIEALTAEFGIGALAPFWASLPPAITENRPLLAARLAFHEHDLAMTTWLLQKVDLVPLEASDRRMWFDLLTAATSPPDVFGMLRDRRRSGRLPSDLLPEYARIAGALGQEIEYRAALTDLNRKVH